MELTPPIALYTAANQTRIKELENLTSSERRLQSDYAAYRNITLLGPSVGLGIGTATNAFKGTHADGFFFLNLNLSASELTLNSSMAPENLKFVPENAIHAGSELGICSAGWYLGVCVSLLSAESTLLFDGREYLIARGAGMTLPTNSGITIGSYDVAIIINFSASVLARVGVKESTFWGNGFLDSGYNQYYGSLTVYTD